MDKEMAENLLSLVKRSYNQIAASFDVTRRKEIWPEVRNLAATVKDGDKVLDVGCGNGRLLEALDGKRTEYLGIDNSAELIKAARRNHPENKFSVVDILDLKKIPAVDFDHIFCLAVWQHIPGEELRIKALQEMKNKLAAAGEIIISVWNLWSPVWKQKEYRKLIFKNWFLKIFGKNDFDFGDLVFPWKNSRGEIVSERYYHAFTKKELRRLGEKSGLIIKSLKKDKFNYWLILANNN